MKLKKILSSVVAIAMAVTTLTAFSTTANAKVVSGNVLTDDLLVTSWTEGNEVTLAKATITAGDISTSGADYLIVDGEWIDMEADYAGFLAKSNTGTKTVNLYKENQDKTFTANIPLIGNYDVQFLGENIKFTSIKFVDSDANAVVSRGSQEAVIAAGNPNNTVIAGPTDLDWGDANMRITLTEDYMLENFRFDGSESLVFKSTGTGNVQIQAGDWSGVLKDAGIWSAGEQVVVPVDNTLKKGINVIGNAPGVTLEVADVGLKAIRYIVKIAEEDAADFETASIQFRNDFVTSDPYETSKCYRSIKADGQTISEDGYVFITFLVNNVPGNFSFDEAIVSFDGERAATFIGANA